MIPRNRADVTAIASLALLIAAVITTNLMQARPAPTVQRSVEALPIIVETVALAVPGISLAVGESGHSNLLARYKSSLVRPAHDRVVMQFMPPTLRRLLDRAAKHFSAPVLVFSAYRSPAYNRQVRGVRNSMHMVRDGKRGAVDFKVAGVSKNVLYAWAKQQPEVNGIGLYCRSDFIHVDNGSKRSWYWGCGSGKTRYAKGSRRIQVASAGVNTSAD